MGKRERDSYGSMTFFPNLICLSCFFLSIHKDLPHLSQNSVA